MRKSIISILLLLLAASCDDLPSDVIENNFSPVRITNLEIPNNYSPASDEDEFLVYAEFNNNSNIDSVWFSVYWPNDNSLILEKSYMVDTGERTKYGDVTRDDNIFTGKTTEINTKTSGRYKLQVFTKDSDENVNIAAVEYFNLSSIAENITPVIYDLAIADTVKRETEFIWSITVADGNGLEDIDKVLFFLQRPDGTQVQESGFEMNDAGDTNFGDQTAGDGIYSYKNTFGPTAQTGTWKFTFKAIDRSGAESNIITHNMVVE